jgi:DNA-binding transcriptional LysR family regulator
LRCGSLSAAARQLGLTQPTIGRHVSELEAALGGAGLFTRSPQGLAPTETALALAPHAEIMAQAAAALIRTASAGLDQAAGTVRLTASEMVGGEILPPILTDFRRLYPEIAIELVLSNRNEDLLHREADIAIRMARPAQSGLIARELGKVSLGLHAHRRYLDAAGRPATSDDLRRHSLIGFDTETPFIRSLLAEGQVISRSMFGLRSDSDLAHWAAIRAGYGIGVCQTGLARRHGEIEQVLAEQFSIDLPMWLVTHADLRQVRRIRLLMEHLAAALRRYLDGK